MGWHWGILASSGGAAGAFDLLETTVLSTTASSVTFTGLGSYSNYKHLQLRATYRTSNSNLAASIAYLNFNSDSGNNYARHNLRGIEGSVYSSAQTSVSFSPYIWGGGSLVTSNAFGAAVIDILDFANTSKNKTVKVLSGIAGAASDQSVISLSSGLWASTNAITSITFFCTNAIAGTRLSLYGVK